MKKAVIYFKKIMIASVLLISCSNDKKTNKPEINKKDSDTTLETKKKITTEKTEHVPTIKIGQQEWMTDDINSSIYNNGDPINEAKSEVQWRDYGKKKIGCYRKLSNGTFIYNGFAVNDNRGIIPPGFVLPTYEQYEKLFNFLGGGGASTGKATKSMATYPIYVEEWVGDDETGGLEEVEIKTNGNSGFKAKKGGFIYDHGALNNEGNCSYWWTVSSQGQNIIVVDIGYCSQDLGGGKGYYPKTYGFAVRALKK